MNAATSISATPTLHRRLSATLLSACAATVLCATAGVARAAEEPADASIVVRYQDLDLQTDAGARALYRRIESAARRVCPDSDARSLGQKAASWSCRQQAMSRAVDTINSPQVASLVKNARLASTR